MYARVPPLLVFIQTFPITDDVRIGSIPREVGMLSALVELDLSSNFLKGKSPALTKVSVSCFRLTDARLGDLLFDDIKACRYIDLI